MTAAARLEAALALLDRNDADRVERGWLRVRLARLLRFAEVAKSRRFIDEAIVLAETAGDRTLLAYARYLRGTLACMAGDVAKGLPEMEAGADALTALSESERACFATRAAVIAALSQLPEGRGTVVEWRAYVGQFRGARELGERLVAAARDSAGAPPGGGDEYFGLGDTYSALGMPDDAASMYALAHDAYVRAGHHILAANTLSNMRLRPLRYHTARRISPGAGNSRTAPRLHGRGRAARSPPQVTAPRPAATPGAGGTVGRGAGACARRERLGAQRGWPGHGAAVSRHPRLAAR